MNQVKLGGGKEESKRKVSSVERRPKILLELCVKRWLEKKKKKKKRGKVRWRELTYCGKWLRDVAVQIVPPNAPLPPLLDLLLIRYHTHSIQVFLSLSILFQNPLVATLPFHLCLLSLVAFTLCPRPCSMRSITAIKKWNEYTRRLSKPGNWNALFGLAYRM